MLQAPLTLIDSAREYQIGPGEMAQLPRGARHGFRNDTDADVRFLCICTPGVEAAGMFAEMDQVGKSGTLTPETLVALCARDGVHFA